MVLSGEAREKTTMGSFRSHSKLGSYLALLALAFQLAVSFGHVHLDRIAPSAAGATAFAGAPSPGDEVKAPRPTGRGDRADDSCPICTLIHLVGTTVPAASPSLPLPSILGSLRLEALVEFDLTAAQGALFQARAPPIA